MSAILGYVAAALLGAGIYLLLIPRTVVASVRRTPWDNWLGQRILNRYADLSRASSLKLNWWQFAALSGVVGLAAGTAVAFLSKLVVLGFLAAGAVGYLPLLTLRLREERIQRQRSKEWPHLVDNLVSGVRAGLGLGETLLEIAARPPASLRSSLELFAADYRAGGNLDASLELLKKQAADPVADRIIEALRLAAAVGGNQLVALLEDLGAMLRAEERTRGEILARQSWTVTGARLAAIAPWIILGLLLTQGQTMQVYATPLGTVILLVGATISIVAYALMLHLGRLHPSPRTLRG